jgi:hypothetical protein
MLHLRSSKNSSVAAAAADASLKAHSTIAAFAAGTVFMIVVTHQCGGLVSVND